VFYTLYPGLRVGFERPLDDAARAFRREVEMARGVKLLPLLGMVLLATGCAFTERWNCTSNPRGAEVYVDGQYMGRTNLETHLHSDWATLVFHVPKIVKVQKEGYQPAVFKIYDTTHQFYASSHVDLEPLEAGPLDAAATAPPAAMGDETADVTAPAPAPEPGGTSSATVPKEPTTTKTSAP
jgi:hypothetical protein